MIKVRTRYLFIVILAALVAGCKDDNDKPKGKYEHGAFIVNEGNSSANGSITFYNTSNSETEPSILRLNSTNFSGLYPQSLSFSGEKGYLVLSGENKIAIADANTFESTGSITDAAIISPRYLEVINDKAYISVWGPYDDNFSLIDSYVLVFDLKTNAVVKKIDTNEGTENLLYNGNYLFASNYNYGASKTVAVINPTDNSLVKQIELSDGPSGLVLDSENKLWVACVGSYGATTGKLYRINTATLAVEKTISISGSLGGDIAVTPDKKNVLYVVDNSIYKLSIDDEAESPSPLFTSAEASSIYAFGVDPHNGNIWIGDALTFSSPGKFFIYSSEGNILSTGDAGIAPGQIVFR